MRAFVLVVLLAGCHTQPHASAPSQQVPQSQRVLHVPHDVGLLVSDATAFAAFAHELRSVIGETSDADALFVLSMLAGLDDAWPAAVDKLDRIAAAEPDPGKRAMRGLTIRVW